MAEQSNKQAEKAGQEIKASVGGLDIIKKHTHTFSGGMDLDTDISLMKADNYRHATNMTLSSYENSAQSVLSSTPGSTERFIIPTINSVLASIQVMLDTSIQKDELNTTPFYNSTSAIGKQSFFICIANYGPYGQIRIFGIALGADGKPLIDTTINSNTTYVPAGKKVAVQIDIWKQSSSSTPISPGWTTTAKYSMAYNKNILYVSTESGTIESFDLTALAQYKKDGYVRAATSTDELVLEPTFLSIRRKDGAFMSGTYQYCYRYYIKGGAQGALSLCSEKIFVMSGGDE
jgi:hypothetical protein